MTTTSPTSLFQRNAPCIVLGTILACLLYNKISKRQLKEGYAGGMPQQTVRVASVNKAGYALKNNNQQQLFLVPDDTPQARGQTQLATLSMNPVTFRVPAGGHHTSASSSAAAAHTSAPQTIESYRQSLDRGVQPSNWKQRNDKDPLYQKDLNLDFVQVPGYYQSNPPPRFIDKGMGASVRYNLPPSKVQSLDPKNPLPYANAVECQPPTKENYDYNPSSASYTAAMETANLDHKSNKVVTDVLQSAPLPPKPMDCVSGGDGADHDREPTVSYDRIIVANLPRQRGHSDYIRGDLPIIPQKPVLDPNSFIQFRPSNGPEVLNTGAIAAMVGAYAETPRQVATLQFQNVGGTLDTAGGTQYAPMLTTAYGQQTLSPQQQTTLMSSVANANVTTPNQTFSSGQFGDYQAAQQQQAPAGTYSIGSGVGSGGPPQQALTVKRY